MEVPPFRSGVPSNPQDPPDPLALLAAWWRAVGAPLARVASLRGVIGRRLQVAVPDAHWKRELGAHRDEILSRLQHREGLEGLKGIDLVLEERTPEEKLVPREGELPEALETSGKEIQSSAGWITDPGMAQRLTAAVARILARREGRRAP